MLAMTGRAIIVVVAVTSGTDNDNDKASQHKKATSSNHDPDHVIDKDYKTLNSSTSNSTVSTNSGTTSTTTPTTPVENNKKEPIKGGPLTYF